jgi:hypothetical protein
MLPLYGRVECMLELGLSAKHWLSAADLDSRARRVGTWKLLQEPQPAVNLSSSRFCVARFFHTTTTIAALDTAAMSSLTDGRFVYVLTGVDCRGGAACL